MALLLPFFKFDVIAWLTSEKIAFMHAQHIGAYIMLLTQCWTQETCTLPNDPVQLKTWGKWQDEQHGDFSPVLACFPLFKKTGRLTNPRLYKEWLHARARSEVLSESGHRGAQKRWAKKAVVRTKRTTESKPPQDWMSILRAMPIYAHIDWTREVGKIEEWHSRPENSHRVINQQFVANWVNKIQAPLSNGQSQSLTCPHHPTLTFPDAQAKKVHDFSYHPKYVG